MIELGIADQVGSIVADPIEIAILSGADRERRTGLHCDDGRERPVAGEPAQRRRRSVEVVDLPHTRKREDMRAIVRVAAALVG